MSTDIVACPRCGANLQNSPAIAGQLVACPQCQTQLQMPQLSTSLPGIDDLLPPTAQLPPEASAPSGVGLPTETRSGRKKSAAQRLRRKPNYAVPLVVIVILVALVAAVIAMVIQQRNAALVKEAHQHIIGNWELADPSDQFERWELAFHTDGRFQMLTQQNQQQAVENGRWSIEGADGATADVRVQWSDNTEERWLVRFLGGQLRIDFPGVGSFNFRAALVRGAA